MRNRRKTPDINAGSMADIAFLLLIFWLVATTLKPDNGLPQILQDADEKTKIAVPTKASDIVRVHVGKDGYYIDDELVSLDEVGNELVTLVQLKGFKAKLVVTAEYDAPYDVYLELLVLADETKIKTIETPIENEKKEAKGGSKD